MSQKRRIYLLGIVTLIIFPIPALWALWFFKGIPVLKVLDFQSMLHFKTLLGLLWGLLFAAISLFCFQLSFFEAEMKKQETMLTDLRLNLFDKIFLSFCAGFGEELLFRAGIQHWLGIILTSILFIAIHGYFNPKNWRLSMYGILLLPFILSLGYFATTIGIWFCIAAHFSYDLLLFLYIKDDEDPTPENDFFNESSIQFDLETVGSVDQ